MQNLAHIPKTNSINFLKGKYSQKQKQQTSKKYKSVIFLTSRIAGLSAVGGGKDGGAGGDAGQGEGEERGKGKVKGGELDGEGKYDSGRGRMERDGVLGRYGVGGGQRGLGSVSCQEAQYAQYLTKQVERQAQIIKTQLSTKQKINTLLKPTYRAQYPSKPSKSKQRLSTTLLPQPHPHPQANPHTSRPINLTERKLNNISIVQKINGCGSFGKICGEYPADAGLGRGFGGKLGRRVKTCYEDYKQQGLQQQKHKQQTPTLNPNPQKPPQLTQPQKQKLRQTLKTEPKHKVLPSSNSSSSNKLKIKKFNTLQSKGKDEPAQRIQQIERIERYEQVGKVDRENIKEFEGKLKGLDDRDRGGMVRYLEYARMKDLNIISNLTNKDYQILQIITNHLQKSPPNPSNPSNLTIAPQTNSNSAQQNSASQPQQQTQSQPQQFILSSPRNGYDEHNENSPRTRKTKLRESYEKYYNKLLEVWHDEDGGDGQVEVEGEGEGFMRGRRNRQDKDGQLMVKDKDNKYVIPKNGLYMSMYMRMHNMQLKYPVNFKQGSFGQTKKSFKQMVIKTKTNMDKYLKKRQNRYNSIRNTNKSLIKNYSYTQIHSMYKNLVNSPRYQGIQNFYNQKPHPTGKNTKIDQQQLYQTQAHHQPNPLQYNQQQIHQCSPQQVWLSGKGYADPSHPNQSQNTQINSQAHKHKNRSSSNYSSNNSSLRPYLKPRARMGNQHTNTKDNKCKYENSNSKSRYGSNIVVELVGPTIKIDPW